jgi:two-component system, sensor histidine kinase and response regulator
MLRQAYESGDISVDLKELFVRVEYDRELLDDVFQIFRQEFPKLLLLLKNALVREDSDLIRASAHTLKGMLSSMSFRSASDSAMCIERMAKLSDLVAIPAEVTRLENRTTSAQASLEQFCERIAQ